MQELEEDEVIHNEVDQKEVERISTLEQWTKI